MKFNTLYKFVYGFAIFFAFLDFTITNYALLFSRPVWWKANPYVRFPFWYLNPYMSAIVLSVIVFIITLPFLLSSYMILSDWLKKEPYCLSMRDFSKYLWNLSTVNRRDLAIFACLALAIIFTILHLMGFVSWINFLIKFS